MAFGERLRALRKALGISQDDVVAESPEVARSLGGPPRYEPITRQVLSHVENGRLFLTKDAPRAILCVLFRITRDELADYLDGKLSLEVVLAQRAARLEGVAAPAPPSAPPSVRYRDHPNWLQIVADARAEDPDLTEETLREVGESMFFSAAVSKMDGHLVAQVARAVQTWHRRAGSKSTAV